MNRTIVSCGILLAGLLVPLPADAQAISRSKLISVPPASAPTLLPHSQYAFEITCERGKKLKNLSNFFSSVNRSLFLLLAPDAPTSTDTLPPNALAAIQVFSIGTDKNTHQEILKDDRDCAKEFLVNGSKNVAIVVTENVLADFSDSAFGQVLSGSLALISPLFSLFTGNVLPPTIAGKITDAGAVQSSVAGILNALNRGTNYTKAIRNLRTGKYVIVNPFVTVTITVRPVASIVLDKNAAFKDDLKNQINAASVLTHL